MKVISRDTDNRYSIKPTAIQSGGLKVHPRRAHCDNYFSRCHGAGPETPAVDGR
jgi:hypothetical protein